MNDAGGTSRGDDPVTLQRHHRVAVLRPTLPLVGDDLDTVGGAVSRMMDEQPIDPAAVVVDLSATALIDGRGLEWLLDLDDAAAIAGGCVSLAGANELCADILRISGVGPRLGGVHRLEKAIAVHNR